ncbi:rab protein [Chrysochromulina tobinii]|uniref:Rab protein n=1 Tax=Chrysochromulina tobinii TaxID=1460289 RepID=A0A0M0JGS7_9EUKA|nr:rab protein [Chrysochromulina tobinii]|eukprot:KOO25438.1 rab protein [Chrysochromulina sp. CCMP291]
MQELIAVLAERAHSAANDGHYSTAHALYFSAATFSRLTSHSISASNMLYKDGQAEEAERSYRTIVESNDKLAPNALSSIEQKMADIAAGKRSPGGRPLGSPPSPIVVIGTIGKTLGDQIFATGLAASESAGDAYTAWSLFASCYALGGGMPARIKLADMLLRLARPSEARVEFELMLSLTGVRDKLSPKNEELVAFKDPKAVWTDAKMALSSFEHVGEEAAAADADAAEQAIGMSGFSASVATLLTPPKPALITALEGGPSFEMTPAITPASKHGPSPSALPVPAAVMSRLVNNLGRVAAVEAASKVVKASEAEATAVSEVVEAMAASEAEARMERMEADAAAPAAIIDAAAPALERAPTSEPAPHVLAAPAPALPAQAVPAPAAPAPAVPAQAVPAPAAPVAVPVRTPTAKAPNADAASSANPAKSEAQPGSARLPVATVLSPNTALPSGAPLLRLIVVGDSGIGKSALLERFVHARFGAKGALATLSVDLSTANVSLGAQAVSVQLFDTAGQERFAPLIGPYYRHADGVLVAYDVGHRTSFERAISYWASEIAKNATPGTPVVLVGTKADRLCEPGYRRVETREAEEAASALGWPYCGETSAATGVSVVTE